MFENLSCIYYKFDLFYMIAKTMAEQEFCKGCNQKHDCQEVYQQLGGSKGPSVVFKVIVAFLVPLLVFIVSLAVFEAVLADSITMKELRAAFSFLLALSVTFIFVVSCSLLVVRRNSK